MLPCNKQADECMNRLECRPCGISMHYMCGLARAANYPMKQRHMYSTAELHMHAFITSGAYACIGSYRWHTTCTRQATCAPTSSTTAACSLPSESATYVRYSIGVGVGSGAQTHIKDPRSFRGTSGIHASSSASSMMYRS